MATVTKKDYADILPINYRLKDVDRSLDITTPSEFITQQGAKFLEYKFLNNINDITNKNYTTNILTDTKSESEIFDLNFTPLDSERFITNIKFANSDRKYLTITKNNQALSSAATLTPLSSFEQDPNTTQSFVFELSTAGGSTVAKIWTLDGIHKKYLVQRNDFDKVNLQQSELVFDVATTDETRVLFNVAYDKTDKRGILFITPNTSSSTNAFIRDQINYVITTGQLSNADYTNLSAVSGFDNTARIVQGTFELNNKEIDTDYSKYSNNFVYYASGGPDIDAVKSLSGQKYNFLFYNNYEMNYLSGGRMYGGLSYFNLKNQITNNNYVQSNLPFSDGQQEQRYYHSILNSENQETSNENLKLGYNFYSAEYDIQPDKYTKFKIPEDMYPYERLNVNDAGFQDAGAYPAKSPYFSDRILKLLNDNTNVNKENENSGLFLCTWLYDNTDEDPNGTGIWFDRYYLPGKVPLMTALEGNLNNTTPHRTEIERLSAQIGMTTIHSELEYYDVQSSLILEPNTCLYYARVGKSYVRRVLDGISDRVVKSNLDIHSIETENIKFDEENLAFNGKQYDKFDFPLLINADQGAMTLTFNLQIPSIEKFKAHQLFGNQTNTGLTFVKNFYYAPTIVIPEGNALKYYDSNFNLIKTNVFDIFEIITDVCYVSQLNDIVVLGIKPTAAGGTGVAIRVNYDGTIIRVADNSLVNQLVTSNYTSRVFYGLNPKATFSAGSNSFTLDLQNLIINLGSTATGESLVLSGSDTDNLASGIAGIQGYKGVNVNNKIAASIDNIVGLPGANDGSAVYFTNYSDGSRYEAIAHTTERIYDINAFDDKVFIQADNKLYVYSTERELLSTVSLSVSALSGYKVDFISEDYIVKPIVFSKDRNYNLIVDKINVDDNNTITTYALGITGADIYNTNQTTWLPFVPKSSRGISPTNLHCLEDQYREYENKLCLVSSFDNSEIFQEELPKWNAADQSNWPDLSAGNWSVNFKSAAGLFYDNSNINVIPNFRDGHNCIQISIDFVTGRGIVHNNGKKVTSINLKTNVKALKNFLFNTFYIGVPNFGTGSTVDVLKNNPGLAKNATMGNVKIFDDVLSTDLLKFLYLNCVPHIDGMKYAIPIPTRNNSETINNFYSYKIPGSLSNKIKIYIKNGGLSVDDQDIINDILKKKLRKYLPATVNIDDDIIDFSIGNQLRPEEDKPLFLSPPLPIPNRRIEFPEPLIALFSFEVTTALEPVLFDSDGTQRFVMVI